MNPTDKLEKTWTSSKQKSGAAQKLDGADPALNRPGESLLGCSMVQTRYLIGSGIAD
jgi:hypothetical protein